MGTDSESTVAPLTNGDLSGCANLYAESFNGSPWNESWTVADARQRLSDFLETPRSFGVCACDSTDQLVGFAIGHLERSCGQDHFLLQEMCVRPDLQRQGCGTALLGALERRVPEATNWYLLTAHESDAARFYQRNGSRPAGRMVCMCARNHRQPDAAGCPTRGRLNVASETTVELQAVPASRSTTDPPELRRHSAIASNTGTWSSSDPRQSSRRCRP